jgi:hypothetical protein
MNEPVPLHSSNALICAVLVVDRSTDSMSSGRRMSRPRGLTGRCSRRDADERWRQADHSHMATTMLYLVRHTHADWQPDETRPLSESHAEQPLVVATHGNSMALILNGFDPSFGYEFWRELSFPDVYELEFEASALIRVRRIWDKAA